jgi:hypothetical protein
MNKESMETVADSLKKGLDNRKLRIAADVCIERAEKYTSIDSIILFLYENAIKEIKEIILDPDNIHLVDEIDEIVDDLERDIWFERSKAYEK